MSCQVALKCTVYSNIFRCMCHDYVVFSQNHVKKHVWQKRIPQLPLPITLGLKNCHSAGESVQGTAMNSSALRRTSGGTSQKKSSFLYKKHSPDHGNLRLKKKMKKISAFFVGKALTFIHIILLSTCCFLMGLIILTTPTSVKSWPDHMTPISHHVLSGDQVPKSQKSHRNNRLKERR